MNSTLFGATSIHDYFANLRNAIDAEIKRIPAGEILNADVEQLASELAAKYEVECPVLGDEIEYDEPPFAPGRDAITIPVHVPYTGNSEMFRCHGHSFPVLDTAIEVRPTSLVLSFWVERTRTDALADKVRSVLMRIREGLQNIDGQLRLFNPDLKNQAAHLIRARQAEFSSHEHLLSNLGQTGFKLRRRADGRESVIIPVKPKGIHVPPPPAPGKPAAEPELSVADYDEILNVIQAMAKVYERSPSVFRQMEEEHLRTILLVGLNGIFKGGATGETFNGEGKNDILIRVNGINIFIAECLFWDGEAKFKKKITEQLFRYAAWRDAKLAAIVFNRKRNFTTVVTKMREVAASLDNRAAEMTYSAPHSCRHRFRRADDPQKHFLLTCLAFEVPS